MLVHEFVGAPSDEVFASQAAVVSDGTVINQIEEPAVDGYPDDIPAEPSDDDQNFIDVH